MADTKPSVPKDDTEKTFLGLTRRRRYAIYGWTAALAVVGFVVWALIYLRPDRWYKYTDQVAFEQVARDVELGYVLWEPSRRVLAGFESGEGVEEPAIASDGARMVYTTGAADGDANLFLRRWDGTRWGPPRPMRALNSRFHERAPSFSGDGKFLYFASDRPGGRGGYDIWVARWDGVEYAWPLPLTGRVNTAFDEIGPALSPDQTVLYFASNRPRDRDLGDSVTPEQAEAWKVDFDIFAADAARETPFDLLVERQLSMLYSLREGALADPEVMAKLGGNIQTEAAVDKALGWLATHQEPDGRWDLATHGGQKGHDVAATAFALLAFYGRGERHDEPCDYQETVKKGIEWLVAQQDPATGDLRGAKPAGNAMYDHGIAALALVEAYGVTKDSALRPDAQASIEFISETQHEAGGWRYKPNQEGDLSVTGWMVMALASAQMSGLRVPPETVDGVSRFLDFVRGGEHGGSYGYTDSPGAKNSNRPAMNAVGFFCAQLMGASSNTRRAFESAAIVDKQGFKLADLYYAYYGTLASYQHQGPVWRNWMQQMQDAFLEAQDDDGWWEIKGGHGSAMGKVIGTALVALCLEAHYRYTPLYGLGFEPDPDGPAPQASSMHEIPEMPGYRHAKHLETISSPADDVSPVVTDHGDFMYFVSGRDGGRGGKDIYRTRLSGPVPGEPENLGPEINSDADETGPAIRMAGFHLLFNSGRDDQSGGLYAARSRRVVRRYDYGKRPDAAWYRRNAGWLAGLAVVFILFVVSTWRAVAAGRRRGTPVPAGAGGRKKW